MIMRIRIIAICIIFTGAALAALFCSGRLVLNTTYSVPVGLWWRVDETLQRGDTVRVPIADFKSTDWMPKAKPLSYFIAHPDLISPLNLFCHNAVDMEDRRGIQSIERGCMRCPFKI